MCGLQWLYNHTRYHKINQSRMMVSVMVVQFNDSILGLVSLFSNYPYISVLTVLSVCMLESGRSFRVSAAIQKKAVAVSDKSLPPQQPAEDFITTPLSALSLPSPFSLTHSLTHSHLGEYTVPHTGKQGRVQHSIYKQSLPSESFTSLKASFPSYTLKA